MLLIFISLKATALSLLSVSTLLDKRREEVTAYSQNKVWLTSVITEQLVLNLGMFCLNKKLVTDKHHIHPKKNKGL